MRDDYTTEQLIDTLVRKGFVPCDIPACNCGGWHHRYGLPERFREIKEALAAAGHPLCNANGRLVLNALKELIAERDHLQARLDALHLEYAPHEMSDKELIARALNQIPSKE